MRDLKRLRVRTQFFRLRFFACLNTRHWPLGLSLDLSVGVLSSVLHSMFGKVGVIDIRQGYFIIMHFIKKQRLTDLLRLFILGHFE